MSFSSDSDTFDDSEVSGHCQFVDLSVSISSKYNVVLNKSQAAKIKTEQVLAYSDFSRNMRTYLAKKYPLNSYRKNPQGK